MSTTTNNIGNTENSNAVKVPGILIDLIPQYLANRRAELAILDEAAVLKDFATIQSIGHKLKGNAGSYGFFKLTDLGASLEMAAKSKDLVSAKELIKDYTRYLADVFVVPE